MPTKWLDKLEQLLVVTLSGFAFWPYGISSTSLITLVVIRLLRNGPSTVPRGTELLLLTPAVIILLAWAAHGFASDGEREVRLWPILLAAVVYFRTSPYPKLFNQSFVVLSAMGGLSILAFFAWSDPLEGTSFAQNVRDAIEHRFNLHPTFLSVTWALTAILVWSENHFSKYLRIAITFLLVAMCAMAGGKMPLLALFLVSGFALIRFARIAPKQKLAIGAAISLALTALLLSPVMKERFSEITNLDLNYQEGDWLSSSELRAGVWQCSLKTIGKNAWWGVGVGNTREALEECYANYEQVEFFDGEYNTHNQFLHFWLSGGALSFLAFLAYLIWLFAWSWRLPNATPLLFVLFFGLICLTENYFSRQFGMMLFAFFVTITPPKKTPTGLSRP